MTQEAKQRALDYDAVMMLSEKYGIPYNDLCAEIRACLSQPATPEWQPIETAPKDGVAFLMRYFDRTIVAHWYVHLRKKPGFSGMDGWVNTESDLYLTNIGATHWMPLPAAPVQEEK